MLAVLEIMDYVFIALIVMGLGAVGAAAYDKGTDVNVKLLALQVRELQNKLDALLKHQGIEMPTPPPSGLSPEVERLASVPDTKIEAIELYRKENRGVGLREAKEKIEAFYKSRQ
jgi:ribosomal protein L7/L12